MALRTPKVPSATFTVTQLNNAPTTVNIVTHTFSSSIGPPTPPVRPSIRSWDHKHRLPDHLYPKDDLHHHLDIYYTPTTTNAITHAKNAYTP